MKVKIFGAGSIGNHLAQASRRMGWEVTVVDVDPEALRRMREDIYPTRYGSWDEAIQLFETKDAPVGGFDMVFIGTPPDSHLKLAHEAVLKEKPKLVLLEKPAFPPFAKGVQQLVDDAKKENVLLCVGFDHVLGSNTIEVEQLIKEQTGGAPQTLDVEFREHWGGIFKAHPWLAGPHESYLGYWERGGGASSEHSHAVNLWQHLARVLKKGRVTQVSAMMDFVENGTVSYDRLCAMHLVTEQDFKGRVVQDVVTKPTRKWARLQSEQGFIEWHSGYAPDTDMVRFSNDGQAVEEKKIVKRRPDDFFAEVTHLDKMLRSEVAYEDSPIHFSRGLDTWLVVSAAHRSVAEGRGVRIDYAKGYDAEKALQIG